MGLKDHPFVKDISLRGNIYYVGGYVRDEILGLPNKDVDLLVTGFNIPELHDLLSKYGRVDLVGVSFGVLKFTPHDNLKETYDIAIPRVEVKNGPGHKGFEVIASSLVSLEEDLFRRDFTINAIAKNVLTGEITDPFDGLSDLKNHTLRATNPKAFTDDPLRILRAIQFSSRFAFSIDSHTNDLIHAHKNYIKEISGERILIEFRKAFDKGNHGMFFSVLNHYNIMEFLTTRNRKTIMDYSNIKYVLQENGKIKLFSEFMWVAINTNNADGVYSTVFKGDNSTTSEIKSIEFIVNALLYNSEMFQLSMYESYKHSEAIDNLVTIDIESWLKYYKKHNLPKTRKELAINGDILREWGYTEGLTIGVILDKVIKQILLGNIKNIKEDIKWYVENTEKTPKDKLSDLLKEKGF